MRPIVSLLLSHPLLLIIFAILFFILIVAILKKVFKLIMFLLILFILYAGYLYFTGQKIPTTKEAIIHQEKGNKR